jgi:putative ABC transport system permease protein
VLLVACGIAVGKLLSIGKTQYIRSPLYGVGTLDPQTFVGVPVILLLVGLAACAIPARRVVRLDVVKALRCE